MTTSEYAGTLGETGPTQQSSPGGAREQAQQAAGTAAEEGKRVASVAQEQVRNVAGEATSQLRGLVDQATREVDGQTRQQKGRLVDTMSTFGDDLDRMASEQSGLAAELAREVAHRARSLSSHLDQREPRDLLDEVRSYARRKPGTFLLGALVAGVVAGRLTRAGRAAQDGSSETGPATATPALTAQPVATEPSGLPGGPVPAAPAPGIGGLYVDPGEPVVRTDTDPVETWTDPSEPGGRA